MSIIEYYLIFAFATALTSVYELFLPVFQELKEENTKPDLLNNKGTLVFFSFVGALVLAPLFLLPCVLPSIGNNFRKGFKSGLLEIGK